MVESSRKRPGTMNDCNAVRLGRFEPERRSAMERIMENFHVKAFKTKDQLNVFLDLKLFEILGKTYSFFSIMNSVPKIYSSNL